MANRVNELLQTAATGSALKQSVIPVLLCDENMFLCMKSAGAEKIFKRPCVKSSVFDRFEPGTVEQVLASDSKAVITTFRHESDKYYAILTAGELNGSTYFAIVFEPQISFLPSETPEYLLSAFKAVGTSVHMLLTSAPGENSNLAERCTRLVRLCTFIREGSIHYSGINRCSLNLAVEAFMQSSEPLMNIIGYSCSYSSNGYETVTLPHSSEALFGIVTTLSAAALLLSDDKHMSIELKKAENASEAIKICVSFKVKPSMQTFLNTYDDLITNAAPFNLELAAVYSMANKLGIGVECEKSDDRVSINCVFSKYESNRVVVTSPLADTDTRYLSVLIAEIFGRLPSEAVIG